MRRKVVAILALLGWPLLVAATMFSINLRTYTADVFVGYNSGDYFEWETRLARGWPFALASFDKNTAQWELSEIRLFADVLLALLVVLFALVPGWLSAKLVDAIMASRVRHTNPKR